MENKFTVTIDIVDNETGATGKYVTSSSDPEILGKSASNITEALCGLINLDKVVLDVIAKKIKEKFETDYAK